MTNTPFEFPISGIAPDEFTDTAAFEAAINQALGFATTSEQQRPGKFPDQYTRILTGRGDEEGIVGAVVNATTYGAVWEVTGAGIVALRDRVAVEEGAVFFARYRRSVNPVDPSGDTVRFSVRWLNTAYATVSTTIVQTNTLTVASGLIEVTATVSVPSATLVAPVGAVYAVPFIETFGTDGKTEIINLGSRPVKALLAERATVADEALSVDAENVQFPDPNFQWPQAVIPEFPVARTFYVTMTGNDANSGTSASKPLRTISAALTKMTAAAPDPCITIVHPGEYLVPRDTVVPTNCALYGYDVRVTKLILANAAGNVAATSDADRRQNMFLLNSGVKVRGFTFTGMRHEPYTFTPSTSSYTPPEKGWAFAFNPGAIITRSPYIADCTCLHDLTQDQLLLPTDRETGNPLIPVGGGALIADGSVLDLDSPLRSVVVDGFTTVNPNGIGYLIKRNAIVQLVSVFTNWSRIGIWTHDGGQVTLANSNSTFGDYAFASTGFRDAIRIEGTIADVGTYTTTGADVIETNLTAILGALYTPPTSGLFTLRAGWGALSTAQKDLALRDSETLLRALIRDFRSGQDRATQYFIKGLFNWDAGYVFSPSLKSLFLETFDDIETAVKLYVTNAGAVTMLENLIALIKDVIDAGDQALGTSPYKVAFPSTVEATGQQFSNSGAGVNYNALPFSQRGTSETIDPTLTILEDAGGVVYATFATESGDTYLGKDLRVDFGRSTIEGQAFSRGVQATALPLIIALGG